ncbi:MAG: DUF899 domain-containing protein [Halieaceae bacterium]
MNDKAAVDRAQWLQARMALLELEKAHARAGDELAAQRRALPKLQLQQDYIFAGAAGPVSLGDLFDGRSQLIIQHFMFGPDWEQGCPSCSFWADAYDRMIPHLKQRDVSFAVVSRGPLDKMLAYQQRMGWTFNWLSSLDNSFNFDFGVSATEQELSEGSMHYNYQEMSPRGSEYHGTSVFSRDEQGSIYHTYSTYGRGVDAMNAAYAFLDLTPRGRDEAGLPFSMAWVKRRDEY